LYATKQRLKKKREAWKWRKEEY